MLSEIKDSSDHILSGKYLVRQTEHQEASFTLLEATYLERTGLRFEPSDYVSFGLADKNGFLTNAGKLMTDQHTVYNSRMFCTRWNGLEKGSIFDDALDDKEYEGNLIYLLKSGSEFIRNNSKVRFIKEAQYRVDKPDYAERAVTEALVDALIHRDYIVLGSEVHIDMFDDRVEITSPGGMFGGGSIQEYDIYSIRSMRRNPVIADLFHRMKYMERRGSGLRKIVSETEKLPGYTEAYKPEFSSTATDFRVILKNVNYIMCGASAHDTAHDAAHDTSVISKQNLLLEFCADPKSRDEMQAYIDVSSRSHFSKYYLKPLLSSGKLEMMFPDKPKKQKPEIHYRSFQITKKQGIGSHLPLSCFFFIPNYIHIIYPYTQSCIANFKLCTLPSSQIAASGSPIGLIKNAITSKITPFCGE
mgnify:CR=1 FL=1